MQNDKDAIGELMYSRDGSNSKNVNCASEPGEQWMEESIPRTGLHEELDSASEKRMTNASRNGTGPHHTRSSSGESFREKSKESLAFREDRSNLKVVSLSEESHESPRVQYDKGAFESAPQNYPNEVDEWIAAFEANANERIEPAERTTTTEEHDAMNDSLFISCLLGS